MTSAGHGRAGQAVRVLALQWEAEDIVSVTFAPVADAALPPWDPGAHVDLTLPNGMRRQYSVLGGDRSRIRVGVDRTTDSRGGSEYVHVFLRPGQLVELGGPRNHFDLRDDEQHWIFIAGGIGVTPIVPMVAHARARGASWELHYAARSKDRMAFLSELGDDGRVMTYPTAEGRRLDLGAVLEAAPSGSGIYVCGPERMLEDTEKHAAERDDLVLHVERFRPRPRPVTPARPFDVTVERSGLRLHIPAQRSLLSMLESHGVRVGSGCRNGLCGACEVRVIAGAVDHRDDVLTERQREASGVMLACVSRAADDELVLDV